MVRIYVGFRVLYWMYGDDADCLTTAGKQWAKISRAWLKTINVDADIYNILNNAAVGVLASFLPFTVAASLKTDLPSFATTGRLTVASTIFSSYAENGSKASKGNTLFWYDIRRGRHGEVDTRAYISEGNWYLLSPIACKRCDKDPSTRNFKARPCLVAAVRQKACGSCVRLKQGTYCDYQHVIWVTFIHIFHRLANDFS